MKEMTDPDILGTRKKAWNTSVATVGYKQEESHEQNLFNVSKNHLKHS